MDEYSGIKELYDVHLRLLKPVEIGEKKYDVNESILSFKNIKLAQVSEQKSNTAARGGYHNPVLVNWEVDRAVNFSITRGILSPVSWAILSNSKLKEPSYKSVQYEEDCHVIEDNNYLYCDLKFCPNNIERLGAQPNPNLEPMPMGRRPELLLKPLPPSKTRWIFIYDVDTGKRVFNFQIYRNRLYFQEPVKKVLVDYTFTYEDKIKVVEVGNRLFNGFLKLDGKMSVKGQNSGEVTTALLELPKIKLSSNFSIMLGSDYTNSVVNDFHFTAYIDENDSRTNQSIAQITFLDKELTGDYI